MNSKECMCKGLQFVRSQKLIATSTQKACPKAAKGGIEDTK